MKPAEYRHNCTVSKQLPYSVVDQLARGTQPSVGVLQAGRVVWLDGDLESSAGKTSVRAYAEGIGIITVDPGSLSAVC